MAFDFINELLQWSEEHSQAELGRKAFRIYVRCLVRKKTAVAEAIKAKYGVQFPKPDDTTMAFSYMLMATRKNKE